MQLFTGRLPAGGAEEVQLTKNEEEKQKKQVITLNRQPNKASKHIKQTSTKASKHIKKNEQTNEHVNTHIHKQAKRIEQTKLTKQTDILPDR